MTGVKSTNLEYSGVLMIAFGVIGLFQAASAMMTGASINLLPLFIVANVLQAGVGWALTAGKPWTGVGIGTNLLLLLARILAFSGETLGVLELGFWIFLVVLAVGLFREGRKREAAEEGSSKK
jgi:hypothetical protein